MRHWTTEIQAIDPITGKLATWGGPHVPGINKADAERHCRENLGYCRVTGELVGEIPVKMDGSPDFDNEIDYEQVNHN